MLGTRYLAVKRNTKIINKVPVGINSPSNIDGALDRALTTSADVEFSLNIFNIYIFTRIQKQ